MRRLANNMFRRAAEKNKKAQQRQQPDFHHHAHRPQELATAVSAYSDELTDLTRKGKQQLNLADAAASAVACSLSQPEAF